MGTGHVLTAGKHFLSLSLSRHWIKHFKGMWKTEKTRVLRGQLGLEKLTRGYGEVDAETSSVAAPGFAVGAGSWWEMTSGGLGARRSSSACLRELYISSVSTTTRRLTWVSIPRSDGVVRCSTVR